MAHPPPITTYDRRLRVFVSSTLEELAPERQAVRAAITRLRLTPVMFEQGARPHPPRELYTAYLDQSDVFVGIYGDRYGWVAPDAEVSGLEEELGLSAGRPRLLYVRTPAPDRDPRLTALIEQVWREGTTSTTPYATPAELAERVADDLAVLLTERFTSPPAVPGLRAASFPVPPTALVGRRDELLHTLVLLRRPDVRLVTLTGPGGIGKTRLALELGATLVPERDGVWFVDLAPVRDPDRVAAAIATTVGVHAEGHDALVDLLLERLGGRRVLLVLDNLEHLLAAAPDLARLLSGCPALQVLATSRTTLGLRGGHDVVLAPLDPPVSGELADVTRSQAVELLVARAQQVRPGFAVTAGNATALGEIARLTEGIPLALELAGARLRLLSPRALLDRLGDRLDLRALDVDVPDRQRTLRATIDWSHALLDEGDRALLARLSVCAGGWTLEAAEALGGDVDRLSSLVGHSLVSLDERSTDEPRFRMLEAVRAYAAERLDERGEVPSTRERLSRHLAGWTARAGEGLTGPENRLWRSRVDAEVDNLRAALRWALETDDADRAVRLAAPLSRYWWRRGMLAEMLEVAEQTAALPSAGRLQPDAEALLLWARGAMRIALGRVDAARPVLEELLPRARRLDDALLLGHALAAGAMTLPPGPLVRTRLEEALELFRRDGDAWSTAYALTPLGHVALLEGDVATATRLHGEALGLAEQIDDDHLRAQALTQLGTDAVLAGDPGLAREHLYAAAALHRSTGDQEGLAYCLDGLAALAVLEGDPHRAARLLGAAEQARVVVGVSVWPLVQPLREQLVEAVRSAIGPEAHEQELATGRGSAPLAALASWGGPVSA